MNWQTIINKAFEDYSSNEAIQIIVSYREKFESLDELFDCFAGFLEEYNGRFDAEIQQFFIDKIRNECELKQNKLIKDLKRDLEECT